MPKVFLPALDQVFELVEDLTLPFSFINNYDNWEFLENNFPKTRIDYGEFFDQTGINRYQKTAEEAIQQKEWGEHQYLMVGHIILPRGTKLHVERYHVSHSGNHAITVIIEDSPDKKLVGKKKGGTLKGKPRIYFKLDEFDQIGEVILH